MRKCINCQPHRAFEPFFAANMFGPVQMARSVARLYNRSGIIITSHGVIMPILCITFKYTGFHIVTARSFHKGTM